MRRSCLRAVVPALVAILCAAADAVAQDPDSPPPPPADAPPPTVPDKRDDGAPLQRPQLEIDPMGNAARDTMARDTTPRDTVPNIEPDAVAQELLKLEGYTSTQYRGNAARFEADEGLLRLHGSAVVAREGERIAADTIVYDERRKSVVATGSPRLSSPQSEDLKGRVMYYDLETRRASVRGGTTRLTEGASWIVHGDVTAEGRDRFYASHARFTTCDLEVPHYHFESDQIVMIRGKTLVARPARLYFGNVPVMWLPFVFQSLEEGRRSGLLMPEFGIQDIVQTSSGQRRRIDKLGFYWAVNEYVGAELSGFWLSGIHTGIRTAMDYRIRRRFLNGSFNASRLWKENGGTEFSVMTSNRWQPDERTDVTLVGQYTTSADYIKRVSTDPREVTGRISSQFDLNRRFDWGSSQLHAERTQDIANGTVEWELPRFSVTPKTITLFSAPPDGGAWYNNASLSVSARGGYRLRQAGEADPLLRIRDRGTTSGNAQQTLTIGNLGLAFQQSVTDVRTGGLPYLIVPDSTGLPENATILRGFDPQRSGEAGWNGGLNYQVNLIGDTRVSPGIGISQAFRRDTLAAEFGYVAGPVLPNLNVSAGTSLYGFFPGVGPYERIRHQISPEIRYRFTPGAEYDEVQERVFGARSGRTDSGVEVQINQTFAARPRAPRREQADTTAAAAPAPGAQQPITLLGINTTAVRYDFSTATETPAGFRTEQISNTFTSDLFRDLQLSVEHDLFIDPEVAPSGDTVQGRRFAPHLQGVSAGIRFGQNSSFIRWLGLGRGGEPSTGPSREPEPGLLEGDPGGLGSGVGGGLLGRGNRGVPATGGSVAGPWTVGLDYMLRRPREGAGDGPSLASQGSQSLNGRMAFALTPNWGVSWNTSYSLTDGEFGSHALTFQRDLHRWRANFTYTQTPTGTAQFGFYVQLIDNPDLKLDYRENNIGPERLRGRNP